LGIGAGAHAKITDLSSGVITRYTKQKVPKNYLSPDLAFTSSSRILMADELPLEFMMNALRLIDGTSLELFTQRSGLSVSVLMPTIESAIQKELLTLEEGHLKPTSLGLRFLNDLVGMF
jgi:oxygen-independent coproporphyrinogen-3 oxidase